MSHLEILQVFPQWYKSWLFESLGLKDGQETSERFIAPLRNLHENWLNESFDQENYFWNNPDVAKAYALYYMSINIPKLWIVLNASGVWQNRELKTIDSIVEFGCGPGTFLWSYLFYLHHYAPEQLKQIKKIRGIDTSEAALKIAENLFQNLQKKPEFSHITAEFHCSDWNQYTDTNDSQLAIFGNALIENSIDLAVLNNRFVNILIIEPGILSHFQHLRQLRDTMVEKGWHIHFPCIAGDHCPMAKNNWCHFHTNRFLLPFIQRISALAKRQNHRHNFTAFLFSKESNTFDKNHWRILSPTRKIKRTAIRYICNGSAMLEAILGRRARDEGNRDFIDMETGSIGFTTSQFRTNHIDKSDTFKEWHDPGQTME